MDERPPLQTPAVLDSGVRRYEAAIDNVAASAALYLNAIVEQSTNPDARWSLAMRIAQSDGASAADAEDVYGVVVALLDKGRVQEALNVALMMATRIPMDHRFTLAAGTCKQRMLRPEEAIPLYAASMLLRPTAAGAFGFAECHAAVGNVDAALASFEAAGELASSSGDEEMNSMALSARSSLQELMRLD